MAASETGNDTAAAGRGLPYKWELILLLWFAFFLHQADRQIFNNLSTMIREKLELSKFEFGLVGTVFMVVYGVMVPLGGYAGDRLRRKWVVLLSLLVFSAATLLTGMAMGLVSLIIFRSIATGGGEAFYYPAANSLIGQYHQKTRAMAMAIHQTALYCGIVCSSFAAWVGQQYGWRNGFYVFGGFGLIIAVLVYLRVRDAPLPDANGSAGGPSRGPSVGEVLRHVFSKPTVLLLSLAFAGMVFVDNGYKTWMPSFLEEDHGLSPFSASFWAMAAHYAGAFVGVTAGGRFSDHFAARRRTVRIEFEYLGLLLGAPFIYWMGMAAGPVACCVALGLFGLFRGVYDSNLFAAPFDVIEPRYRASAVGIMLSCAFVMGASSSAILGWMADHLSMRTAIASMSAVYVLSGLIVIVARYTSFHRDYVPEPAKEAEA